MLHQGQQQQSLQQQLHDWQPELLVQQHPVQRQLEVLLPLLLVLALLLHQLALLLFLLLVLLQPLLLLQVLLWQLLLLCPSYQQLLCPYPCLLLCLCQLQLLRRPSCWPSLLQLHLLQLLQLGPRVLCPKQE